MSSYICSVFLGKWGCITGRGGIICEDDGTIWYGTQAGKVENCTKKGDKQKDEKQKFYLKFLLFCFLVLDGNQYFCLRGNKGLSI